MKFTFTYVLAAGSLASLLAVAVGCSDSPAVAVDPGGTQATPADGTADPAKPADPAQATDASSSNTGSAASESNAAPVKAAAASNAPAKALNKTFDDLKFEIERDQPYDSGMISDEIKKFLGKRIRIRGWIKPSAFSELPSFILVRDNKECCFGPGAMLYDCIRVKMADGKTTRFTSVPIAVEGVLTIDEMKIGKKTWSVYYMLCDKVE